MTRHAAAPREQSSVSHSTTLAARLMATRAESRALAEPLTPEDQTVQSMPDASPAKWHLAHTTWFFETFILSRVLDGYRIFDPAFGYLFNSYYEAEGERHPRPRRGMLTRPCVDTVRRYRAHVDEALMALLDAGIAPNGETAFLLELGIHHEQQHQELLLTDILHLLSLNPLRPAYRSVAPDLSPAATDDAEWIEFAGGIHSIGHNGDGFAFDNEGPRHEVLIRPFRLASRPVTNAEWMAFIADDGYRRAELWLSDGWATVQAEEWSMPRYWTLGAEGGYECFGLNGGRPVEPSAPVAHVSYYEADAFARWAGKRLPLESEWELAAATLPIAGNMLGSALLRPAATARSGGLRQMFGDVWEWTQSPYMPYPGFEPATGAVGEYNGKFMCNQFVLRGGSCVTPEGHIRATYRNFFYPHQRWQFSGLRLAEDA